MLIMEWHTPNPSQEGKQSLLPFYRLLYYLSYLLVGQVCAIFPLLRGVRGVSYLKILKYMITVFCLEKKYFKRITKTVNC